jgi:putative SOS response-associated peptidase YedK
MCGRFAQATDPAKLAKQFGAEMTREFPAPGYNVAPTALAAVVRIPRTGAGRVLEALKWGLIPSWARDPAIGAQMANARAETAAEKPSFRSAFRKQRCLVPVDGFYEWKKTPSAKHPYYFTLKNGEPFALAGLWEVWKPKEGGEPVETFTILTTGPNPLMAEVHDRMPVILAPGEYDSWLDPALQDRSKIQALLKSYPAEEMESRAVSTYVNSTRNQGEKCIQGIEGI